MTANLAQARRAAMAVTVGLAVLGLSATTVSPAFAAPPPPAEDTTLGVLFNCATYASNKPTTRAQALARAQTWIDARVPYSQSACFNNQHGDYRTDCSGFVSMIWGLRSSHTTWTLEQVSHPIARADLRPGDALNNPSSHVALFVRWADAAKTQPVVREQAGPDGSPTVERTWTAATAASYTPIRYDNIVEGGGTSDINGDGKADMVGVAGDALRYYYGDGTGNFHWGHEGGTGWSGLSHLEVADFNGDGKADMVGIAGDKLRYYYGDGSGNFHWGFEGGTGWSGVSKIAAGDVNGDGKADMVAVAGDALRYYYGDGTGNLHWGHEGGTGWSGLSQLEIADVNGDGKADMVGIAGDALRYYYGDGSGNFHWGHEGGTGWSALSQLGMADVNGDRKADLVGVAGDKLRYYYGDGSGNFHWGHEGGVGWDALSKLDIS